MDAKSTERDAGVAWGWRQILERRLGDLEDTIDRMALRLGDVLFGERISEKLFGPHPTRS